MIISQDSGLNPEKKKRILQVLFLFILTVISLIAFNPVNKIGAISADQTTIQAVPTINSGHNAADAVVNAGHGIQDAVNSAGSSIVNHNSGYSSDDNGEGDADAAASNIMGAVVGNSEDNGKNGHALKVDGTARTEDLFKVENRLGYDAETVLLNAGHWICGVMFVVGVIVLIFSIFSRRHRWMGVGILATDLVVMFILTNLGSIINWWVNYGHALIA